MTYISPVGQIGLIMNKDYHGDSGYRHTGLFATERQQKEYFDSCSKLYTNYQYNKDRNTFTIGDNIKNVSRYSYMWFCNAPNTNEVFETKRYYCFITDIKLINNNATEISFTVDIMQTFLYDINIPPCLVEREHTSTDNLFENIIPEDITIDETLTSREDKIFSTRMLSGIILKSKIAHRGGSDIENKFDLTFAPSTYETDLTPSAVSGTPNSLFWYCGFPSTIEDVEYYRNQIQPAVYYTQPLYFTDEEGVILENSPARYFTISSVVERIVSGDFYKLEDNTYRGLSEDDIVAVFMYPDFASHIGYQNEANDLGYAYGTAVYDFMGRYLPTFKSLQSTETYTPKNNKLYTYPYSCIEVINNQGQSGIYKFENFKNAQEGYEFRVIGNFTNPAMMVIVPLNYDGDDFEYEKSLSITGFSVPYYKGDVLNQYLQQNANKRQTSLLCSVLSATAGIAATVITKNPMPAMYGVISGASSVLQQEAKIDDLRVTPPQAYSTFNTDFLNPAIRRVGFVIKTKGVRMEQAKIIDDYFTMYGYRINTIKRPNVFQYLLTKNEQFIRPKFNYLKTRNALTRLEESVQMCDSETLSNISTILNNGITFWSDITSMGNYVVDNSPQ